MRSCSPSPTPPSGPRHHGSRDSLIRVPPTCCWHWTSFSQSHSSTGWRPLGPSRPPTTLDPHSRWSRGHRLGSCCANGGDGCFACARARPGTVAVWRISAANGTEEFPVQAVAEEGESTVKEARWPGSR
jgi:hypothetical protein